MNRKARFDCLYLDHHAFLHQQIDAASQYSALAQFGLPLEKLQTYSADINAVTAEQAGAAAKAHYDPANATLIVVGDAAVFWDKVKDKRSGMERCPSTS